MGAYYDEIEIEDMAWDPVKRVFHYPCPCGDRFEISRSQLRDCEDIATCPSCSLIIRVVYDPLDFEDEPDEDEDGEEESAGSDEDEEDGSSGSEDEKDFVDALEELHIDGDKSIDTKEASDSAPMSTVQAPAAVAITASV